MSFINKNKVYGYYTKDCAVDTYSVYNHEKEIWEEYDLSGQLQFKYETEESFLDSLTLWTLEYCEYYSMKEFDTIKECIDYKETYNMLCELRR